MENVNELKNTGQQQVTTLTNIIGENGAQPTTAVKIDATAGLVGASESAPTNRPVVRINPTAKKPRRTVVDPTTIQQVNPNDFIPKTEPVAPAKPNMREDALMQLDAAVARKKAEFQDFIAKATAEDEANRELIKDGLETVGEEMQYMPDELHVPIAEKDKVTAEGEEFEPDVEAALDEFDEETDFDPMEQRTQVMYEPGPVVINHDTMPTIDSFTVNTKNAIGIIENTDPVEITTNNLNMADYGTYTHKESVTGGESYSETVTINNAPVVTVKTPKVEDADVEQLIESNEIIDHFAESSIQVSTIDNEELLKAASSSDFDIDDSDLDDVTDIKINEDDLSEEEIMKIAEASDKRLRTEILEKIIQTGKTIDTTQFVISTKAVSVKDALKGTEQAPQRTASWPLMYAGRPFIASALKGPEIALLANADTSESENGLAVNTTQARIMYEHDANPFKPATFEAWCKTIPFADVDNIFAAIYKASMSGANYIPRVCEKPSCQYSYLTDDINIDSMIKFGSDKAKERFNEIQQVKLSPENSGQYQSVVSVINDRFAIGLKVPSFYTVLYEYASLNTDFIRKYSTVVNIIQYIDYIYLINPETKEYQPIGWKLYPTDITKNFKSKIATYSKILKEFDDKDFSILMALINSIVYKTNENSTIEFEVPETKCPKCGSVIPSYRIVPRGLVFMRQRLVDIATTPTVR